MDNIKNKSEPLLPRWTTLVKDLKVNKYVYIMAIPFVLWYIIFEYVPMYGVIIAFQDYNPLKGMSGSRWIGFEQFQNFFSSYYFARTLKNTLIINIYQLLFSFPAPIILALLLNEVRSKKFKKAVQTITYLPHFISLVVICGLVVDFVKSDGLINNLLVGTGLVQNPVNLLLKPEHYRTIYISSGIWQHVGFSSIIYLAALTGIDMELYEAAAIDGARRFRQLLHITLPGIMPTIIILFILQIGRIMSEGAEKGLLLYNASTYEVSDIISTYTYRAGIQQANFGYGTAVGLFNSVVNLILIVTANSISRKVNETSLW